MSILAAVEGELPFLRTEAEAMMRDKFAAYSPGSASTDADGMTSPSWVLEGTTKGKLRGSSLISHDTSDRQVVVGLVQRGLTEGALHIPVGAKVPEIGWEYVCTKVGSGGDKALIGTRWSVVNVPAISYATARRLDVVRL